MTWHHFSYMRFDEQNPAHGKQQQPCEILAGPGSETFSLSPAVEGGAHLIPTVLDRMVRERVKVHTVGHFTAAAHLLCVSRGVCPTCRPNLSTVTLRLLLYPQCPFPLHNPHTTLSCHVIAQCLSERWTIMTPLMCCQNASVFVPNLKVFVVVVVGVVCVGPKDTILSIRIKRDQLIS